MISLWEFFQDLTNPALAFLPKALLIAVMSATVCGVVGTHVVLRGMAFIGDAVAHAVFPGIAIAFVLQGSMLLGGAVAGVVIAVLVTLFSQNRRVKEDTVIGIFFAFAFALGLIIISQTRGYTASLSSFLFGSITGVPDSDMVLVAVVGFVVIAMLLVLHKELVTVSLDRETARAQRLPVLWLDLVLYLLVTAAVVISVRTIGNILVFGAVGYSGGGGAYVDGPDGRDDGAFSVDWWRFFVLWLVFVVVVGCANRGDDCDGCDGSFLCGLVAFSEAGDCGLVA